MENRLPKQGWYVKNDGSQKFNLVIKYMSEQRDANFATNMSFDYYGITAVGDRFATCAIGIYVTEKELTIDEFIYLSMPIKDSNENIDAFMCSIQPHIDDVTKAMANHPT